MSLFLRAFSRGADALRPGSGLRAPAARTWFEGPLFLISGALVSAAPGPSQISSQIPSQIERACFECHDADTRKGGLDLSALPLDLANPENRDRWTRVHDRVKHGEMPPKSADLNAAERRTLVEGLDVALFEADRAEVLRQGRGPLRRLNRVEYEQILRDLFDLPDLEIRGILPEDREAHRFNKTTEVLEMSHVQLAGYLDAADAALRAAVATEPAPPERVRKRMVGTDLFPGTGTFGNRESMFFARDNKAIDWTKPKKEPSNGDYPQTKDGTKPDASAKEAVRDFVKEAASDETVEMALFRSASWPYIGTPRGFTAPRAGYYRVRMGARAVLQQRGYVLTPALQPLPMTFRTRKPAGADIINEVRAEGGVFDILPEGGVYETTIRLRQGESFEYSLLGLPMPLAQNPNCSGPTYRYPPFPEGGQPGLAVQSLEVEGPLSPPSWPPASHRVLFDDLGVAPKPAAAEAASEAVRLVRRFIQQAAREPVSDKHLRLFETLVQAQLARADSNFVDAVLTGCKAFLASGDFVYVREPRSAADHAAVAVRLALFLSNSGPDARLLELARQKRLGDPEILRGEAERLVASPKFERFVNHFTDYWLNLRHIRRDDPDVRLFPEYRFDEYLVESMERETRAFFTAMLRENLPATVLVKADFTYANDRLARHYQLEPLDGSAMRKTRVPAQSPYGGLLTQGAVLKVSANGTNTSPVVRGAWVMERLIGRPPPPPPPSVPAVEPDIRGAKTIRELLELHTREKSCAACHLKFDPVGVALENFDVLGGWRTRYRGTGEGERVTGIDRAGHDFSYALAGAVDSGGQLADGTPFRHVWDLKDRLAADPRQLARNLLHQFTLYATGTPVRYSDRREVEALLDQCAHNGYRVRDLLVALVQSPIFLGPVFNPHRSP